MKNNKMNVLDNNVMMEIRGLSKEFSRNGERLQALLEIDLDVVEGEFLCLVGPSGCGKTTFLRIVQGLIEKSAGSIELYGKPITQPSADRGFVFQQDNLYPWRTVIANARLGLELAGMGTDQANARANEMLKLADWMNEVAEIRADASIEQDARRQAYRRIAEQVRELCDQFPAPGIDAPNN